jgi:hypothetical protein
MPKTHQKALRHRFQTNFFIQPVLVELVLMGWFSEGPEKDAVAGGPKTGHRGVPSGISGDADETNAQVQQLFPRSWRWITERGHPRANARSWATNVALTGTPKPQ